MVLAWSKIQKHFWACSLFLPGFPFWLFLYRCIQPSDYVNAILVPEGGQVPLDIENLAAQGIFHVVRIYILLAMMVLIDLERMRNCCFSYYVNMCILTTSCTSKLFFLSLVLAGIIDLRSFCSYLEFSPCNQIVFQLLMNIIACLSQNTVCWIVDCTCSVMALKS